MSVKLPYKDDNVISRSFRLMSDGIRNPEEVLIRSDYDLYTSFFSTAIGDNRYINPLPGYGLNTDPYPKPIMENRMGNMGRYYKRIHHDNAQTATFTACVPEFTGLLTFLLNMFDYSASVMVTKGRAPSWAFYIGQAAGAIAFWPAQILATSYNFFEYLMNEPKNKWYYGKLAMGMYFTAAQGIFNDLMVNAGYTLTVLPKQGNTLDVRAGDRAKAGNRGYETNSSAMRNNFAYMNSLFPDAINEDGTIDITRLSLRGVRKYRHFLSKVKDLDKNTGIRTVEEKDQAIEQILDQLIRDGNFVNGRGTRAEGKGTKEYLDAELRSVAASRGEDEIAYPEVASAYTDPEAYSKIKPSNPALSVSSGVSEDPLNDIRSRLNKFNNESVGLDNNSSSSTSSTTPPQLEGNVPTITDDSGIDEGGWLTEIGSVLMDQLYGGMDGVTFRVEGTGPVSDSFSNSFQQSAIASTFNSTVQAVSDFKFNIQGGATGIGLIDGMIGQMKDAVAGVASGSVIGNLPMALLGNSRVEIPEHWQDSTANLHTESFSLFFEAPYAHPYSIATNVFLPLSLILPFIVPFSTGGATYGSPFMIKCFQRGKSIIRMGMVRNASISFGEGPLGWTTDMKPRNCRVTIDVADFEPIMSVPISRVTNPLDLANMAAQSSRYLGDRGKYQDFISRTAGVDYLDTVLRYADLNRRLTRFTTDTKNIFKSSTLGNALSDSIVGDVGRIFSGRAMSR